MLRLGTLFRKRRAPDPEQWQVGDQAECIFAGTWLLNGRFPGAGPRLGETRIVRTVEEGPHCITGEPIVLLCFARYSGRYEAGAFRKVHPRADEHEASEPEFASLIRKRTVPAIRQPEEVG